MTKIKVTNKKNFGGRSVEAKLPCGAVVKMVNNGYVGLSVYVTGKLALEIGAVVEDNIDDKGNSRLDLFIGRKGVPVLLKMIKKLNLEPKKKARKS